MPADPQHRAATCPDHPAAFVRARPASRRLAAVVAGLLLLPAVADLQANDRWRRPSSLPKPVTSEHAIELDYCVAQTNDYRASVGRPALLRSRSLEAYAAAAAPHDGSARAVHRYFRRTRGGGVAFAENLIPWWPLPRFGSVREIIRTGLAMMWAEGRGGGHYDNMVGQFSQVGCGVFVDADHVTVVQAFR
jgi:hypothetical protein